MLWIPCFGWLRGFHFTICLSNLQQVKYGFQLVLFIGHHWRPCTFERAIIQRLSLATFFGVGSTNSLLLKSMGEAITRVSAQDYRCEDFFPEGTRYLPADSVSTSLAPAVTGTTRFGSDRPRWNSPIWRSFCRRNHGFSTSMLVYPRVLFPALDWCWNRNTITRGWAESARIGTLLFDVKICENCVQFFDDSSCALSVGNPGSPTSLQFSALRISDQISYWTTDI